MYVMPRYLLLRMIIPMMIPIARSPKITIIMIQPKCMLRTPASCSEYLQKWVVNSGTAKLSRYVLMKINQPRYINLKMYKEYVRYFYRVVAKS
jgi:hypothetical protein